MATVGILIERQRTYGRRLCEGIIKFARERSDWTLRIVDFADLKHISRYANIDGYIARVMNDKAEKALRDTGKPVVDVFFERRREGFAAADQNARLVGQMAARHFIEHRFTHFAFCGYNGRSYSDRRRDAFVRCLSLNHFGCCVYRTPPNAIKDFDDSVVLNERFSIASDHRKLRTWISRIEKPVAVFCSHDMRAYHLAEACREEGIRIPDEVAILGADDDELVCHFTNPPLSSIDQNAVGIGYAAAQTLQKMFDDPGTVPPPMSIKPNRLKERGSTRIYPVNPPWLSDALVFIRRNISQNITACDVHTAVGKSHTIVDAAFRKAFGTSVQKTIMRTRLEEAKRLILDTELPLSKVAERSGFSTVQYFHSSFATAFGRTPAEYRKAKRGKNA